MLTLDSRCPLGNNISHLPSSLSFLTQLSVLVVGENPLVVPPESVVRRGTESILKYLGDLLSGTEKYCEVNLVLVGDGEVGKTTFRLALDMEPDNRFFKFERKSYKKAIRHAPGSTRAFERCECVKLGVQVWDFAGQLEYYSTHQLFLSDVNAVYCIVVKLNEHEVVLRSKADYWLRFLKAKTSRHRSSGHIPSSVVFIGSHMDLVLATRRDRVTQLFKDLVQDLRRRFVSHLTIVAAPILRSITRMQTL
jgi:Ras of Complex, Roc, domain of DAPkinase